MAQGEGNPKAEAWQWQQQLINDYYDYRWRKVAEPLCETFRRWKEGELPHSALDKAIEEAYRSRCTLCDIFSQRPDRAVALIQILDPEWFEAWVKEHRMPRGEQPAETPQA